MAAHFNPWHASCQPHQQLSRRLAHDIYHPCDTWTHLSHMAFSQFRSSSKRWCRVSKDSFVRERWDSTLSQFSTFARYGEPSLLLTLARSTALGICVYSTLLASSDKNFCCSTRTRWIAAVLDNFLFLTDFRVRPSFLLYSPLLALL